MVYAAIGGAIGLDAAMKDATEALWWSLRRFLRRLPRLLGARLLLPILLSRLLLTRRVLRLPLSFRFTLRRLFRSLGALFVLLLLCVRRSKGSEKKQQKSCGDESNWFHVYVSH